MNFYELFEKKEAKKSSKKDQEIGIRDPKAARALDVARTKYAYAETDLEAFVKMMQDEQEEDDREFKKLETDTERQEREIKDLKHQDNINSAEINKLEKETDLQQTQLKTLNAKEVAYEKKVAAMTQAEHLYKRRIEALQQDLEDLENRLAKANVKGFTPAPAKPKPELPDPEEFEVPDYGDFSEFK